MFYLASQSPRRKQLLEAVGLVFSVLALEVEEVVHDNEPARQAVWRLALEKAAAGVYTLRRDGLEFHPVMAADTMVVVDGRALGKPNGREHAIAMLEQLSGRTHRVLTAVVLHDGHTPRYRISESLVTMKSLDRSEVERYWLTGEPRDKAGGYALQGLGSGLVERLEGSYSGVVGMPMFEARELLTAAGIDWL